MKLNTPYSPELDILYVELPFYETWHGRRLEELDISQFADVYCEKYQDIDPEGVRLIQDYGVFDYTDLPETAQEVWQNEWKFDFAAAKLRYAQELFDYFSMECGLEVHVRSIDFTRDNFQRPDLAVLIRANEGLRQKLNQRVQELTTPRDGYIPFYTEEELWADRGWLIQISLEILLDEFLTDDASWPEAWHCHVVPSLDILGSWKEAA